MASPQTSPSRPNIVLILADDLGYSDLGCFGSEIRTPHLDALAKQGVRMTQFYNQARCCPTRASLLTGKYPHQVGIGAMIDGYAAAQRKAADSPAYQDHLDPNSPTIAEELKRLGYRTMMAGKWHLGAEAAFWPDKRGFDRSFALLNGAMNYYGGDSKGGPRTAMSLDGRPWTPPHDGFYSTEAFTDRAIEFVDEATKSGSKPFFLYLAYNASHWPLQAPESDVAAYKGTYDAGFQISRKGRMERMRSLGIVGKDQVEAAMDRGASKPWNEMSPEVRSQWARRMEIYAAQTTILDRGIGRVVAELKRLKVDGNTLIVFLSDNGGAAEDPNSGDREALVGSRDSFRGYGRPWASVSNTPWRRHKVTAFEGGISTPFIAVWPDGIPVTAQNTFVRSPGHILDLFPTFLALAGEKRDQEEGAGHDIRRMIQGESEAAERTLCWEHEGNRAIRRGRWKLVANFREPWQLYNIQSDRIEANDLAAKEPERVTELAAAYDAWAKRCGVIPWSKIVKE